MTHAIGAKTEQGEMVDDRRELVSIADTLPERMDIGIVEIDHHAALLTNQVVMTGIVDALVVTNATTEIGLGDETKVAEQFEGPINRRPVDRGRQGTDTGVDLVGGQVLARSPEGSENHQSLGRDPLPNRAQPGGQFFGAGRMGDRRRRLVLESVSVLVFGHLACTRGPSLPSHQRWVQQAYHAPVD
jgi:hypothetical protein